MAKSVNIFSRKCFTPEYCLVKALSVFYALTHSEVTSIKACREIKWKLAPLKLLLALLAFPLVTLELNDRNVRKSFILCQERQNQRGHENKSQLNLYVGA